MSISPECDCCHKKLVEFGGILLGPPNEQGMVKKDHLCRWCYDGVSLHVRLAYFRKLDETEDCA